MTLVEAFYEMTERERRSVALSLSRNRLSKIVKLEADRPDIALKFAKSLVADMIEFIESEVTATYQVKS